jgi:hypothetical protein
LINTFKVVQDFPECVWKQLPRQGLVLNFLYSNYRLDNRGSIPSRGKGFSCSLLCPGFPKDWKEGIILKIPKKGDYRNCNNWQGITLLVVISKSLHSYYTGQNIMHTGNRNSEGTGRF